MKVLNLYLFSVSLNNQRFINKRIRMMTTAERKEQLLRELNRLTGLSLKLDEPDERKNLDGQYDRDERKDRDERNIPDEA